MVSQVLEAGRELTERPTRGRDGVGLGRSTLGQSGGLTKMVERSVVPVED